MRRLLIDYLSPKQLSGFDKYKYRSVDTSPFAVYIMHPFWDKFVKIYPLWLSPNLLTFAGWLLTLGNFLALAYIDWDFKSSKDISDISNAPRWLWLACAISQFLSHTLDGTDGKQARRTQSSSPLGEMFDHGLDSLAVFLMPMSMYTVVGNGITLQEFYLGLWLIMLGFFFAHWEKYNTSVLYLPWAYDFSQVGLAVCYLVTLWYGPEIWTVGFWGGWRINHAFKFAVHFSFWGLGLPVTVWHIIRARWKHPESCPSVQEGLVPLMSIAALFSLFSIWAWLSPSDVCLNHPRVLYFAMGTVFSNITCRLIVAQMCSTPCQRFNWLFLLLIPTVLSCITGLSDETNTLYIYTLFAVLAHVHYGVCVVNQLCDHLGIRCFLISKSKSVANGR